MADFSDGDILKVGVVMVRASQQMVNTLWYAPDILPSSSHTVTVVGEAWRTAYQDLWRALLLSDTDLQRVDIQSMGQNDALDPPFRLLTRAATSLAINLPGQRGAANTPTQDAVVITLRTGQIGRRRRGRIFIPSLLDADHTDGLLNAGGLIVFQAFAELLDNPFSTTAGGTTVIWQPVVFSKTEFIENGGATFPSFSAIPITSALARPVVRVQRRRQIGVGG